MEEYLVKAKESLDDFFEEKKDLDPSSKNYSLATEYLKWVEVKTQIIKKEKEFVLPEGINIKRGDVFWAELGYNIDEEYGGRHPVLVLRRGGNTIICIPISTQEPTEKQIESGVYVEIDRIYEFRRMRRWVNVLNAQPLSIQRLDFSSKKGNVKGYVLDNISEAVRKCGLWK